MSVGTGGVDWGVFWTAASAIANTAVVVATAWTLSINRRGVIAAERQTTISEGNQKRLMEQINVSAEPKIRVAIKNNDQDMVMFLINLSREPILFLRKTIYMVNNQEMSGGMPDNAIGSYAYRDIPVQVVLTNQELNFFGPDPIDYGGSGFYAYRIEVDFTYLNYSSENYKLIIKYIIRPGYTMNRGIYSIDTVKVQQPNA